MKYNQRTESLVKRSIIEARIRNWFKISRKKNLSPSLTLTKLARSKRGLQLNLTREERKKFVDMIYRIDRTKKIISKNRKKYGRRPRLFYKKVFGFLPREQQTMKVVWNTIHVHFIFEKNDMISFWRKVQWGPGSGGYYSVGDRDIKIQELRGLVSFGRAERHSIVTRDIIRHESVHAFEDFIKMKKPPNEKKLLMYYKIKSELNACLNNFKYSKNRKRRIINEEARLGLGIQVKEDFEDYLSYHKTLKRIRNLKSKIRKTSSKRERRKLNKKLKGLKNRLEQKRKKRTKFFGLYRKTTNQIKKALEIMPINVLQRIIYETPYERLHKKIPEAVNIYKRMNYEWYKNN